MRRSFHEDLMIGMAAMKKTKNASAMAKPKGTPKSLNGNATIGYKRQEKRSHQTISRRFLGGMPSRESAGHCRRFFFDGSSSSDPIGSAYNATRCMGAGLENSETLHVSVWIPIGLTNEPEKSPARLSKG